MRNTSTLLTQVDKGVAFSGRTRAIHLRLMPLHLMHKDHLQQPAPPVCVLYALKTICISRTFTHTQTALTEVNRLVKSQSEHCLSLSHTHTCTLFLSLLCLSHIFPGTVTLPCKLLTQQTLLRCGSFTTPASAERSALSQPISFQWGPAPL